jgi:hypothetical protein
VAEADVFRILSAHWAETAGYLTSEDVQFVRETSELAAAAAAGTGDSRPARAALLRLTTMLYDRLPTSHPVSIAISSATLFGEPSSPEVVMPEIAAALEAISALTLLGSSDSDEVDDATSWLLAAPALTAQQVRDSGADPAELGLIRLDGPGGRLIPAFQFSPAGTPIAVVLTINRLLDAEDDPFGVADWWLGRNAWLEGVPADLIGQVDDALLIRAARAELGAG